MSERYELIRVPVEQDRAVALRELARAEVVDPAQYEPSSFDRLADTAAVTEGWTDVPLDPVDFGDEQPVGQRRRPAWPLAATAAAVIAIVVAALVLVIADDDTNGHEVPAGPPSTVIADAEATQAEQIARAFIETRWSDPDQALSYVSDDVTCSPASRCLPSTGHPALPTPAETSRTAESLRLEAALFEALGDKIVNVRCEQQDTSASGISIRCTYHYHTFRSEELGRGPFELGPDDFVVRDRKIVSISPFLRFGLGEYFRPIWDDFRIWLSIQHPDDIALMYEGDAPDQPLHGIDGWLFSEQSIALWARHTLEYATDRAQMGIMGLPAEDTAPSTPENGELVVGLYGMTGHGETAIYVYADGRLISHRHRDVGPPEAVTPISTGYLVQRLTPEGVELLRAEVLSSGLYEEYHEVDGIPCAIQVRNGDRVGSVACSGSQEPTPEQIGWDEWLRERLADPAKWLPPSAWEDQAHTPYVPSRFRICLYLTGVIPEAAAEVLAEGTPTTVPYDPDASCTELSTEQARTLAAALDDAGARRVSEGEPEFDYDVVDTAGQRAGNIMFTPYLPHGEAPCLLCG